ncbi:MAG: cytochrome c, partial [Deltaproteobacteria bacterium]|nr:cytochrome c [Deltaproteobacteria bacterium]
QAKAGSVEFIPQIKADVDRWKSKNPDSHILGFIPTEPMDKFLKELKAGNVNTDTAKPALREKNLAEGRALYAMNCRPCHGDSVSGDGPMADGFKLRPINFTDNGTIETIVEGYTFWRVSTGGLGLPQEATPWDSAMPVWNLNLTEEERWKIIMAEYDMAQKTARIPEKH